MSKFCNTVDHYKLFFVLQHNVLNSCLILKHWASENNTNKDLHAVKPPKGRKFDDGMFLL